MLAPANKPSKTERFVRFCSGLHERNDLELLLFPVALGFLLVAAVFSIEAGFEKLNRLPPEVALELVSPPAPASKNGVESKLAARNADAARSGGKSEAGFARLRANAKPAESNKTVVTASAPGVLPESPHYPLSPAKTATDSAPAESARQTTAAQPVAATNLTMPNIAPAAAATAAPPAPPAGVPSGSAVNTGAAGHGVTQSPAFNPSVDTQTVAGNDFGAQRSLALSTGSVDMGNIGPYKRRLFRSLTSSFKPSRSFNRPIVVTLQLAKDGTLLGQRLDASCGYDAVDHELYALVNSTQFEPLPDWFRGDHLFITVKVSYYERANGKPL